MVAYDLEALPECSATWRAVRRESALLKRTSDRLFADPIDPPWVLALARDDERSERVEAFAGRYSRLQDTLGERLFPRLVGQEGRSLIDRLKQLERLGLLEYCQSWLAWRNLRSRLVHEYAENPEDFVDALGVVRDYSAALCAVVARIDDWLRHLGIGETELS